MPMDRADILALLRRHKPELQRRFGVLRLALFGSRAREEAREDSDTDVLVSFDGPASSARYFGVQFYLEDVLGCPVDLVTDKALRPELRPFVERDAVHVRGAACARMAVLRRRHGHRPSQPPDSRLARLDDDTLWIIVRDDIAPLRDGLTKLLAARR